MKKFIILSTILSLSILSFAQSRTIEITPGMLESTLAGEYSLTALTIKGSMDVRDFACINDNLTALTTIDLSGCSIKAYDSRNEQYLGYQTHFNDNVIPASAFLGFTELENVILPSNTTAIGNGAFAGCEKLTTVTGGDMIEVVGEYAFSGCSALKAITFPATLRRISDYAFDKCTALAAVDLSQCNKLSYIGKRAFAQNASLATVKFANTMKTLGEAAFAGCNALLNITLPASITHCGKGAFAGCSVLEKADFSEAQIDTLSAWTFAGCPALIEILLPQGITAINEGAFYYCSALPTIALPAGIENLDSFAFAGCNAIQSIDFMPENLESIGRYAFYQNTLATKVSIPETTSYIGDHAFDGCINASDFTTEREMPAELGEMVFANMNVEEKSLNVPTESVAIYEATAQWQDFGKINGISAVEDVTIENKFGVAFEQYNLLITSAQEMTDLRLFNTAGMLLAHIKPHSNKATIDTQSFVDNIYLIHATTADGQQAITKVARVMR